MSNTEGANTKTQSPRAAAAGLIEVNQLLRRQLAEATEQLRAATEELRHHKEKAEVLLRQAMLASLHATGLDAELAAFKSAHPDSELLNATDVYFANGTRKTRSRLVYERAFDARGRDLGIIDPSSLRPK